MELGKLSIEELMDYDRENQLALREFLQEVKRNPPVSREQYRLKLQIEYSIRNELGKIRDERIKRLVTLLE